MIINLERLKRENLSDFLERHNLDLDVKEHQYRSTDGVLGIKWTVKIPYCVYFDRTLVSSRHDGKYPAWKNDHFDVSVWRCDTIFEGLQSLVKLLAFRRLCRRSKFVYDILEGDCFECTLLIVDQKILDEIGDVV